MPELPEVETTRRGILPCLRGRRIRAVEVREPRLQHLHDRLAGLARQPLALREGVDVGSGVLRLQMVAFDGQPVDLVISDMAPNMSGIAVTDQARSVHLSELALEFAGRHLKPGGNFLVKIFQGAGFDAFRKAMAAAFDKVVVRKPKSSRDRSSEVYLLGLGCRPHSREG